MLKDAEQILMGVKDDDVLKIHTLSGRVVSGHWFEDGILSALNGARSFTEIGPMEYRQNDIY